MNLQSKNNTAKLDVVGSDIHVCTNSGTHSFDKRDVFEQLEHDIILEDLDGKICLHAVFEGVGNRMETLHYVAFDTPINIENQAKELYITLINGGFNFFGMAGKNSEQNLGKDDVQIVIHDESDYLVIWFKLFGEFVDNLNISGQYVNNAYPDDEELKLMNKSLDELRNMAYHTSDNE